MPSFGNPPVVETVVGMHFRPPQGFTIVERALFCAGIEYERADNTKVALDFYLPADDIYIEVKQFHSEWIASQMARTPNVIAIQGMDAAKAFAKMLGYKP